MHVTCQPEELYRIWRQIGVTSQFYCKGGGDLCMYMVDGACYRIGNTVFDIFLRKKLLPVMLHHPCVQPCGACCKGQVRDRLCDERFICIAEKPVYTFC